MRKQQIDQLRAVLQMGHAYIEALAQQAEQEGDTETLYPQFEVPADEIRKSLPEHLRHYVKDGIYCLTLPEMRDLGIGSWALAQVNAPPVATA